MFIILCVTESCRVCRTECGNRGRGKKRSNDVQKDFTWLRFWTSKQLKILLSAFRVCFIGECIRKNYCPANILPKKMLRPSEKRN